jgi:hypothetical protein
LAKMCIHIPDGILAKVKENKHRMNISRVCSAALLKEVEVVSNIPPMVSETERLIGRLRDEMQKQHIDSFNLGVKLAQAYLSRITPDQLSYWGSLVFSEGKKLILPEEVEDYIERCSLEKKFKHPLHRPSFSRGWLGVMNRAWTTVKDKY